MTNKDKPKPSKKKNGSFNFIDLLLLLLILAAVGTVAYVLISPYVGNITITPTTAIEYKIRLDEVRLELRDKIQTGDTVVDTATLDKIGKVKSIEYEDVKYIGADSAGNTVESVYPDRVNIILTVSADATTGGGLYKIGSFHVTGGVAVSFRTPGFIGEGYCTSVGEVKK